MKEIQILSVLLLKVLEVYFLLIDLFFWIGLFEGDILIDQETKNYLLGGNIMSRDALISPIFYWPRGTLYYTFDPKLGEF